MEPETPLRPRVVSAMNDVFLLKRGRPDFRAGTPEEKAEAYRHSLDYYLKLLDGKHEVVDEEEKANHICDNPERRMINATLAFLDFTEKGHDHLAGNPASADSSRIAAKLIPLAEKINFYEMKNAHRMFIVLVGPNGLAKLTRTTRLKAAEHNFGVADEDERMEHVLKYANLHLKPLVLEKAREMYGLEKGEAKMPENAPSLDDVLSGKWPEKEKEVPKRRPEAPKKTGFLARLLGRLKGK